MAKIIAIANQKGGVGKTTTTVNLGFGLARAGKRVLLIDADPQGSLTVSLGYHNPDELEVTLASILLKIINDEELAWDEGILPHDEKVFFIPANIELSGLEVSLTNVMSREAILKSYLDYIKDDFDYILIDCMPSLGMLTINALVAADSVLIPVQAGYLPVKGLEQLTRTISMVKKRLNRSLYVEGILMTLVDTRTNFANDIIFKVHEAYGTHFRVCNTIIPISVKAGEASAEGISIFAHAPKSKIANAYRDLAQEVIQDEI